MSLKETQQSNLKAMYELRLADATRLTGQIASLITSGDFDLARMKAQDLQAQLTNLNATANHLAEIG